MLVAEKPQYPSTLTRQLSHQTEPPPRPPFFPGPHRQYPATANFFLQTQATHFTLFTADPCLDSIDMTRLPRQNLAQIRPILSISLMAVRCHLTITPLLSLQTVLPKAGARREHATTPEGTFLPLTLAALHNYPLFRNLLGSAGKVSYILPPPEDEGPLMSAGPAKPNKDSGLIHSAQQSQARDMDHARPDILAGPNLIPTSPIRSPEQTPSATSAAHADLSLPGPSSPHQFSSQGPHQPVASETATPQLFLESAFSNHISMPQMTQQKLTSQPVRRSPRLKQKGQHASANINHAPKSNSKTKKISFHIDPNHPPLDADTTLQIMEASGLQISEEVRCLIDQAVLQDKSTDTSSHTPPTTPLHDHIPPLEIPGEALLL